MSAATCTKDETCSRCGLKGKSAHGHNWVYDNLHTTACTYCHANYKHNIKIVGKNLPYSEDGASILGVRLSNNTGVFINDSGKIIISAWIEFDFSCDYYSSHIFNVNIYSSSGTLISSKSITVISTYCEYVIANLPDHDTYYIEIT